MNNLGRFGITYDGENWQTELTSRSLKEFINEMNEAKTRFNNGEKMSDLISGKEALIALANGEDVEYNTEGRWVKIKESLSWSLIKNDCYRFRLKPQTITINGVEVPAPFEPKAGDTVWFLSDNCDCGYGCSEEYDLDIYSYFGWWRTEDEVKQVVERLKSIFDKKILNI